MRDLDSGWGLASRQRAGEAIVAEECAVSSAQTVDPLATAFEADLAAWVAWLEAARDARADEHAMRRLEFVYGTGWTAVTVAALAVPLLGVVAGVLTIVFFVGMLVLGVVVTAPRTDRLDATTGAVFAWPEWSTLGPAERAQLVRIINLSRLAARPPGVQLLVSELDEALAAEPLASWPPLRDLRNILRAGWSGLIPFGSEALSQRWEPTG